MASPQPAGGFPVWLRVLIVLVTLPAWLGTVGVYLLRGEPPPAEILTIPLLLIAATSLPTTIAEAGRRVLGDNPPAPPPPPVTDPREEGGQP